MNMKVLTILGSPRPTGFSSTIARKFNETARENGAEVLTFELQKLDYKGCAGCFACKKKTDACTLTDGLTPVLEAMHDADIIVLATPVSQDVKTYEAEEIKFLVELAGTDQSVAKSFLSRTSNKKLIKALQDKAESCPFIKDAMEMSVMVIEGRIIKNNFSLTKNG